MEIKLGNGLTGKHRKIPEGSTMIDPNPIKKSVMIDRDGNQIDPVTKRIIKRKDE